MKEHIVSYILKDDKWWCGLNITNHSFDNASILIEYYTDKGVIFNTAEIILNSGCMVKFMIDISYGWARIISPNNITISEFMGDDKSSMVVFIEKRDVVIKNVVPNSKKLLLVENSKYIDSFCTCPYIAEEYMTALKYIARALNYKFPNRVANKTEIVNACPAINGTCPENSAHYNDGACVDLHYFTLGDTNHTQTGGHIISIWEGWSLTDLFDKQRNMEFVLLYKKIFPKSIIYMHSKIREAIGLAAWQTYGEAARVSILASISPEDTLTMNHHLHTHCNYGGVIDREAIIC